MTAQTPAQAAHAAHYQALVNGHIGSRPVPYDELGPMGENAWDDIARAGATAEVRVLRGLVALREAELEQVRNVIDGFTANPEVAELLPAAVIANLRRRTGLPAKAPT